MDKKTVIDLTKAFAIGTAMAFAIPIAIDYIRDGCGPTEKLIGRIIKTECSSPKAP